MTRFALLSICFFFSFISIAGNVQHQNDTIYAEGKIGSFFKESFVIAGYQDLRSTHIDHFTGFNLMVGHNFTPKFSVGIEVENIFGPHHDDNGWKLSEIRLVPVILDARYLLKENTFVMPFLEVSTGITFLKYYKKVKVPAGSPDITETDGVYNFGPPFLVKEKGLYAYAGAGAYFRISKHLMPFIGIGFKGFNMSTNVYDVNPRGLNFEIGCKF